MSFFCCTFAPAKVFRYFRKVWKNCFWINLNAHFFKQKTEADVTNPARQDAATDGVKYPKNIPADESYLDEQPSYASNEVAINWNVTLFALSAGIDALQ